MMDDDNRECESYSLQPSSFAWKTASIRIRATASGSSDASAERRTPSTAHRRSHSISTPCNATIPMMPTAHEYLSRYTLLFWSRTWERATEWLDSRSIENRNIIYPEKSCIRILKLLEFIVKTLPMYAASSHSNTKGFSFAFSENITTFVQLFFSLFLETQPFVAQLVILYFVTLSYFILLLFHPQDWTFLRDAITKW